ncbi:MAG: shikimate dehydrogenase [Verrucomicrobiota bacterium]|nr:shikimate dehydrogenase [Limisphaera sp.]MDW8381724.1 shikimate dehydrogenase [Verrucomicrobiota bacterium]
MLFFCLGFGRQKALHSGAVPDVFAHPIDASTRYCAVFGFPVRHSASPAMHNAGLAALGLNWRYLAFSVPPQQLKMALQGAAVMRFVGINLTVPHKLLALPMMDVLDSSAKAWGAVNTVRFEGRTGDRPWQPLGQWSEAEEPEQVRAHGFNTDADALIRALDEDLRWQPEGRSVLLLGAGGAGRVAALRLAASGVRQLYLINRTRDKAHAVAVEIQQRYPGCKVSVDYPMEPVDLILNATSLGLKSTDPLPLDLERFPLHRSGAVYDMIYRPMETALLEAARRAGRPAANGLGMLLHQGTRALEIWTGRPAPVEVMRRALWEHVYAA